MSAPPPTYDERFAACMREKSTTPYGYVYFCACATLGTVAMAVIPRTAGFVRYLPFYASGLTGIYLDQQVNDEFCRRRVDYEQSMEAYQREGAN